MQIDQANRHRIFFDERVIAEIGKRLAGILLVTAFGNDDLLGRLWRTEQKVDGTTHGVGVGRSEGIFARQEIRLEHHLGG